MEGDHILTFFFRLSDFEANRGTNIALGQYRGMLPRKFFENLGGILVFFEQFLRKFLFKVFTANFDSFAKCDAFCSHISIYACYCLTVIKYRFKGLLLVKRFKVMEKLYLSKTTLKRDCWGYAYPTSPHAHLSLKQLPHYSAAGSQHFQMAIF